MTTATKTDAKRNAPKRAAALAKSTAVSAPPAVSREDWRLFCSLNTLPQKAGVPADDLPKLVVKELVDNALDAAEADGESTGCDVEFLDDDGVWVGNPGTIPGTPNEIAAIFSVGRPLTSTKAYRRPGRGALGNGTRVVAGAVLASKGSLVVSTNGRRLELRPLPDGRTEVVSDTPAGPEAPAGYTRVEVVFGPGLPVHLDALDWGLLAVELAVNTKKLPIPKPSIHWHTADSFADLLRDAVGGTTVRQVVQQFDGLTGSKLTDLKPPSTPADGMSADDASLLHKNMQWSARRLKHSALGEVGSLPLWGRPRRTECYLQLPDGLKVPAVVEVWARTADEHGDPLDECGATVCVNRTPTTADVSLDFADRAGGKSRLVIHGAELHHYIQAKKAPPVQVLVNVQCPYMPIVNDSKEPNLDSIAGQVLVAITKAVRYAQRMGRVARPAEDSTQKAVVIAALPEAIARVSSNGRLPYSLRRLFYAIRPILIERCGKEPDYGTFGKIIGDFEDEQGSDLPGIYRDNRGSLYHPHERRRIPLGTRTVAGYTRPRLLFNKVVYCEKEGLFPLLEAAGFPERHDCALVTSKGFASRAIGDVLDKMEGGSEPIQVFCVHDADGPGTVIVESLRKNLRKRAGRDIEVIDLGLNPAEGRAMGLAVEPVERRGGRKVPVGQYIPAADRDWLQTHRIELDAMDADQTVQWLDGLMAQHAGKVVPPVAAVGDHLAATTERLVRDRLTARILREADLDGRVADAMIRLTVELANTAAELATALPAVLAPRPERHWTGFVHDEAGRLAGEMGDDSVAPGS